MFFFLLVVISTCGGDIDAMSDAMVTLRSPGFPEGYESNMLCEWHITAPPGYDIVVEFEVSLEIVIKTFSFGEQFSKH